MSDNITRQEVLDCSDPVFDALSEELAYFEVLPKHFYWLVDQVEKKSSDQGEAARLREVLEDLRRMEFAEIGHSTWITEFIDHALSSGDTEPAGAQKVREPVQWFAEQMEKRLKENDHKGGWEDSGIVYLFSRLKEEVEELADTMPDDYESLIKESTDVANFAMMIADNARKLVGINTGEGKENAR